MSFFPNIVFIILLCIGGGFFIYNLRKLIRNIRLGKPEDTSGNRKERLKNMLWLALGQRKMLVRPIVGVLHIIVYAGFLIINIELLEIITDGIIGTHRIFASLGTFYNFLIASFEVLALLVIVAVTVFWIRRNVLKLPRFRKAEIKGWAKKDLYYSKHLHILLAFPNTYYAPIRPLGASKVNPAVTQEVKLMLDPNADPFATPQDTAPPDKFGASDVTDLTWLQLMNAYTCTECGRCTDECPANLTGKKLSPRAIMMKTRDRLEEVGRNIDKHGTFEPDGKQLLGDYITPEELWACTTCNACVEVCPVNISPLSIIMDMRQYLVMEESAAPTELNVMMTNIENNGAPWAYSQADRDITN